jgi:hypothetical protein
VTVLVHAGDWIEAVVLGFPAIAFGVWLAVTQLRDRWRRG